MKTITKILGIFFSLMQNNGFIFNTQHHNYVNVKAVAVLMPFFLKFHVGYAYLCIEVGPVLRAAVQFEYVCEIVGRINSLLNMWKYEFVYLLFRIFHEIFVRIVVKKLYMCV